MLQDIICVVLACMRACVVEMLCMSQNHNFSGSEHTSQAARAMPQIVKKRSGTLAKEAAYDDRGQYASWSLPGSFSEGSGCLPNLSWARLGRTWAAFGQLLDALGCVLGTFCKLHGRSWLPPGSRGCLQPRFWTSLVPPGWVLESSIGSFRHCFWPCLSRVATDSM